MIDTQRLLSTINILEVLAYYSIYPDRKGFIPCITHKEKTGSMKVYEKQNVVHCYGCGVHYNAIDFVMQMEKCSFLQAVEKLEIMFGIKKDEQSEAEMRKRLKEIEAEKKKEQKKQKQIDNIINNLYLDLGILEGYYNKIVPSLKSPKFVSFQENESILNEGMYLGLRINEVKTLVEDIRFLLNIIRKKYYIENIEEEKLSIYSRIKKWKSERNKILKYIDKRNKAMVL